MRSLCQNMWSMMQTMRVRLVLHAFVAPRYTLPRYGAAMAPITRSATGLDAPMSMWQSLWHRFFDGHRPSCELALAQSGAWPMPTPAESTPATLWDGLLLAAPKKKVSHSRKAMRAANKGLKDRVGMYSCYSPEADLCQIWFIAPVACAPNSSIICASIAMVTLFGVSSVQ